MVKIFAILIFLLPISCFAQFSLSGRILSKADAKPIANASVFLNNTTIGVETADDGTFTLHDVKPGKFDLVVSIIGFERYSEAIVINNTDKKLRDISLFPKTIKLSEIKIRPHDDPNRGTYYDWFKDAFLGTSNNAQDCKILNPEILFLDFDKANNILSSSTNDFLEIVNNALGYRIKYLLGDFSLKYKERTVFYKGQVLFEELKGSRSQEKQWQKARKEAYEGSQMHFLRSLIANNLFNEGFKVQQFAFYANPDRPADSLIDSKIKLYKQINLADNRQHDSLSYWIKKSKLQKRIQKLMPFSLATSEFFKPTDKINIFTLGCENDGLYIAYSKSHNYHVTDKIEYINNKNNNENTLITFNAPYAFFYGNGIMANPYSIVCYGVWGRNAVAELLPVNYEPSQSPDAHGDSTAIGKINTKLNLYTESHITEKAYLHLDKPYYAAGDTIYFKAYVTMGERHLLSAVSGVLHVDLINSSNKIDQSIKSKLDSGVAWGDFALPDSLPKGNYRIRAYTRWMRNNGETGFFEQSIQVGSLNKTAVDQSPVKQSSPINNTKGDIQFFAEGGSLVNGIHAKVAFKAIGPDGLGVAVSGTVMDDMGNEILKFASVHLGMGYFYLKPEEGRTYKSKVTYDNGTHDIVDLPKAEVKGIAISVDNDSIPKASVKIEANAAYYDENKNKEYSLLIWSGGIATAIPCTLDSQVIKLDILKRRLKTGVATVTLFSPNGEPLCERLLFVQNYDQLNINLITDKTTYAKREKANIKLNVKNRADSAAAGHFSVSVIDESKVTVDQNSESTIFTNLLLTSNLKGYIEQPNYYFTNTDKTSSDLDLVMLTHGYRRFEWKKLLNNEYPPITWQSENSLEITGTAKTLLGKPINNGTVSLISQVGGPVLAEKTDAKGNFRFSNLLFMDTTRFVLNATNAKGKNHTQIIYSKDDIPPVTVNKTETTQQQDINQNLSAYLQNKEKQQEELNKYGLGKGKMLKEVKIKAKRKPEYETQSRVPEESADQVIRGDQIRYGGPLAVRLMSLAHGIRFIFTGGNSFTPVINRPHELPMLIIINGQEGGNLEQVNTDAVASIEVLLPPNSYIYGPQAKDGALVITTKPSTSDTSSIGVLPIVATGFYKAREFYAPKYEHPKEGFNRPDLRSTIYWNPEIKTDKNGNASFDFYNADGTGNFRVVVEGVDENGNLGRQVVTYKVE